MNQNRLDGVLARNRKHLLFDLALAAFFLMALLFSGLSFGNELPKLSPTAPRAVAGEMVRTARAGSPVALADSAESSPRSAAH